LSEGSGAGNGGSSSFPALFTACLYPSIKPLRFRTAGTEQNVPTVEEPLNRHVARFADRVPDWDAFADARIEGYRRAQHRFIGAGASGKRDARVIPAEHCTLSVMSASGTRASSLPSIAP